MSLLSRLAKIAAEKGAEKLAARTGAKAAPRVVESLAVKPRAPSLAVKPKAPPKPKALPAPKKVLALPAPKKVLALPKPGPGLPDFAAKPKGGQWWTGDSPYGVLNPAAASKERVYLSARFSSDPTDKALAEWWDKALPRYIQNDFATPDDPLRALADRGYLQGVENSAQWSNRIKNDVVPMPLQRLMFDPKMVENGVRNEALSVMPWINKMPATDNVYGFWPQDETVGALSHIRDEMVNALKPDASGIPADLAVRPESLARMSFPQAAERVGQINQWRAKQAEQAQISALNNPAIHTFKEYTEDNPLGLRWVELKAPQFNPDTLPEGYSIREVPNNNGGTYFSVRDDLDRGREIGFGQTPEVAIKAAASRIDDDSLQQALKYEGDTMGHCVGGYCDDVLSGRSRIFSLRDAKGEPHVTIETAPGRRVFSDVAAAVGGDVANQWLHDEGLSLADMVKKANIPTVDDIVQIKGKQNRAPKDDYLPFVQDFVKSQQWGNIGDFGNTGLVKLPDGRYITQAQLAEIHEATLRARPEDQALPLNPQAFADFLYQPQSWHTLRDNFEGYAVGGKVDADRCFSYNPLSVRRG